LEVGTTSISILSFLDISLGRRVVGWRIGISESAASFKELFIDCMKSMLVATRSADIDADVVATYERQRQRGLDAVRSIGGFNPQKRRPHNITINPVHQERPHLQRTLKYTALNFPRK